MYHRHALLWKTVQIALECLDQCVQDSSITNWHSLVNRLYSFVWVRDQFLFIFSTELNSKKLNNLLSLLIYSEVEYIHVLFEQKLDYITFWKIDLLETFHVVFCYSYYELLTIGKLTINIMERIRNLDNLWLLDRHVSYGRSSKKLLWIQIFISHNDVN